MTAVMMSEWIKVRTVRSHVVMFAVALGFPVLVTVLTMVLSGEDDVDRDLLSGVTVGSSVVTGLLAGVIGVLVFAQEHAFGTLRVTFAATPVRTRALVAKALVVALFSAALALAVILVCTVVGQAIVSARDLEADLIVSVYVALVVVVTGLALLGLALGMLMRNAPGAIAVLILWPLLAEGLIGGLLSTVWGDAAFKWLPVNTAIQSLSTDAVDDAFSRPVGLLYFAAWVLAFLVAGIVVSNRRDA